MEQLNKKIFEEAELELVEFEAEDILTTSSVNPVNPDTNGNKNDTMPFPFPS